MILIFSTEEDFDTNTVIKWINFYGKEFRRINAGQDFILKKIDLQNNDILIENEGQIFNLKDVKTVWYRRKASLNIVNNTNYKKIQSEDLKIIEQTINASLSAERNTLAAYLKYVLEGKRCLTRFSQGNVNKLIVLEQAKACGLSIPNSWVVTNNDQVFEHSPNLNIITKASNTGIYKHTPTHGYYTYTESVTSEMLSDSADNYFPSLVQEKVDKEIELRIFFLEDEYYPMAIFSQLHELSTIDNRKGSAHNKLAPYKLPEQIKDKLKALMNCIGLRTGSIDVLVTKENDYVFLEVNPVGQIGMTSYPCNYNLHKKIAEWLIK